MKSGIYGNLPETRFQLSCFQYMTPYSRLCFPHDYETINGGSKGSPSSVRSRNPRYCPCKYRPCSIPCLIKVTSSFSFSCTWSASILTDFFPIRSTTYTRTPVFDASDILPLPLNGRFTTTDSIVARQARRQGAALPHRKSTRTEAAIIGAEVQQFSVNGW